MTVILHKNLESAEFAYDKHGKPILHSLKPDFHSRFSLVASEIFRKGHAQNGETNRTGRKNISHSVRI